MVFTLLPLEPFNQNHQVFINESLCRAYCKKFGISSKKRLFLFLVSPLKLSINIDIIQNN